MRFTALLGKEAPVGYTDGVQEALRINTFLDEPRKVVRTKPAEVLQKNLRQLNGQGPKKLCRRGSEKLNGRGPKKLC